MRILYIDIDSLRPDHLGCYGYHRKTSPNIDSIAKQAIRFDNYYVTDSPCLPSRTAMFSGRFGIHTGVINHGGLAADPIPDGAPRGFRSSLAHTNWMTCLRQLGLRTGMISSFPERHSAFHLYAGFSEMFNPGKGGMELADEVTPPALDWLARHGHEDNWFLHINYWDPHTPYRTPESFGNPFKNDPLPAWLTDEVRKQHWSSYGPHSAQEVNGFRPAEPWLADYPQQPSQMNSMADVRTMFDGYDRGILYADHHIGILLKTLSDMNLLDDTAIIITSDHGENLGELNIYGDHQTADHITNRVPLIVKWPGLTSTKVDTSLHYHFDFAASVIDLLGGKIPDNWDGQSFAPSLRAAKPAGRPYLILSQGAWSCQRAIRFDDYLCIRSYHDGYHPFPEIMLFNLKQDPHEQHDIALSNPAIVATAMTHLDHWLADMMRTATHPTDPMWTVISEGGPLHTRTFLPAYLERLRATGRSDHADALHKKHPNE
ncbi:MAG TPA: sulfatase [Tepidisphaeraceae bacterium]|jgi:arylsulfatase A-like enzyme|nr:sulfatase [Tepidisphaeraceae bacterium]